MHINFNDIISKMTLHEKIGLLYGHALFKNGSVERLGVPALIMSDGPCGVRFDHKDDAWIKKNEELCYVSWLPSGTAIASSWNTDIAYNAGVVLGSEARGRGKDVILAPGINIHRTPMCGRNFEYMSEDPYLTGIMASSEIIGIQEQDVAACVKHFALNNQEKDRMSVDVSISDRALYEIYLPAFRAVIDIADSYTLMCSYNKIRGCYASESKLLMTDILRKEWNYDGVIISDWGAVHSTIPSALNGVDIEMGVDTNFEDYYYAGKLEKEVEDGNIPISVIDERVRRILELQNKLKINEEDRNPGIYNTTEHHSILLNAARESIVLLKNDDNVLPLNAGKIKRIAVIGDAASRKLANGGGSSEIQALFEISPLLGINMISGGNVEVHYCDGYYVDNADNTNGEVNWQAASLDADAQDTISGSSDNSISDKDNNNILCGKARQKLDQALKIASSCDAVIYIGGLNRAYDTEGFDRTSYKLPYNQDIVINALLDVNPNTVIYIQSGSAVCMSSFAERAKTILWSSMNGMQGGLALAEIIFGKTNPSGRLPVTFAADINDYPSHSVGQYPGTVDSEGNPHCSYDEGIFVGYRHFATKGIKTVFDFGHGLSYTEYEYSGLRILPALSSDSPTHSYATCNSSDKNGLLFDIELTVKNTGDIAGSEVVMMFISQEDSDIIRPAIELKGFTKVCLEPGESEKIKLHATPSSFAYYDEDKHCYRASKGKYQIKIGRSVSDIRLSGIVELTTDHEVDALINNEDISAPSRTNRGISV